MTARIAAALVPSRELPPAAIRAPGANARSPEVDVNQDQATMPWQLEENFWLCSADFYAATLAWEALMVLPPLAGTLQRAATIEAIRSAQPLAERMTALVRGAPNAGRISSGLIASCTVIFSPLPSRSCGSSLQGNG